MHSQNRGTPSSPLCEQELLSWKRIGLHPTYTLETVMTLMKERLASQRHPHCVTSKGKVLLFVERQAVVVNPTIAAVPKPLQMARDLVQEKGNFLLPGCPPEHVFAGRKSGHGAPTLGPGGLW